MSIIKLETKNIRTLALLTLIGLIGTGLLVWLTKGGYFTNEFTTTDPYIAAFQPLLFAGLPIVLAISFILGVATASREDLPTARWQAVWLIITILVLAYICSFTLINQGF